MAKVFDNLYPSSVGIANLHLAWHKAAKGKRSGPAAASFELSLSVDRY